MLTADCLPVLFCDRAGTRIAAAHAGWRGLAAGVLARAVEALGVPGDQLLAWIGPAIGPAAFEVGGVNWKGGVPPAFGVATTCGVAVASGCRVELRLLALVSRCL